MRLGLLFIGAVFLGWNSLLRIVSVNHYLSWISSCLLISLVLYGFAMVNYLQAGLYAVMGVGILGLLIRLGQLLIGRGKFAFEGFHLFDWWLAAMGVVMGWTVYHSPLLHYDNYSHWALIVKYLFVTGHLPNAATKLIDFTSYPPATALFILPFVKAAGFSAGVMLLAQLLLIWSALYALFGVLRDRRRALMASVLCFVISISFVFNVAIRLNNLLVDYVLPVVAAAGIAGIYINRHHTVRLWLHVALFSAGLLLIKNAAAFYVAVCVIYALWTQCHQKTAHRLLHALGALLGTAAAGGLGYLPFYFWSRHVKTTFKLSKHEISSTAYRSQLAHESIRQVKSIAWHIYHSGYTLSSLSFQGIVLFNVVLFAAFLLIRFWSKQKNPLLKVLLALDLDTVLYDISLFGMYILSMPYAEAKTLDGFERYRCSVVILNLFIAAMALVVAMDRALFEQRLNARGIRSFASVGNKTLYQTSALVLLTFSIIMVFSETNGVQHLNWQYRNALPNQMERIARQSMTVNTTKVLVVDPHANDVGDYFTGYVGRYWFMSNNVIGQENFDMNRSQFRQTVESYQYIAIPEWHRTFTVMLGKVFHQHEKTGLFKVTKHGLHRVSAIKVK